LVKEPKTAEAVSVDALNFLNKYCATKCLVHLAVTTVAAMEELDADNKRLSYQGHFADRDIVQVGCISR